MAAVNPVLHETVTDEITIEEAERVQWAGCQIVTRLINSGIEIILLTF
jgi:hypothetical protein